MSEETTGNGEGAAASAAVIDAPREKLTKKAITADQPTWCPGCGDFANRVQEQDRSYRRDRSTGQPDEKTDRRRGDIHCAHARRERYSHDPTDRARDGPPGVQRHRMLV